MSNSSSKGRDPVAGIIRQFGMVGIFFLTLSVCGFIIVLLDLLGLSARAGERIPTLQDPRPLVISSLGLLILGMTPLMFRLLVEGENTRVSNDSPDSHS